MESWKEGMIDQILSSIRTYDNLVSKAQTILTDSNGTAWGAASTLSTVMKPFCYIIIGIILLLELANVASKVDIIKWEHGLKVAIKVVLARVCIDIAPTFLQACFNQANIWINSAASVGSEYTLTQLLSTQIQQQLADVTGFFEILGIWIPTLLISFCVKAVSLFIQVVAFGRMFEVYLYFAVSPLPCAFFPLGDGSGGGMSRITQRFFKSFIAACLQGVMILMSLRISNAILGGTINEMVTAAVRLGGGMAVTEILWAVLLGGIVMASAVAKCGSWAKQIIDAA